MWRVLSFVLGALAAVGLADAGFQSIEPLHGSFVGAILAIVIVPLSAGIPTWLVGRLHPRLLRAHLLAYFATLLVLFVLIAMLNMEFEL